MQGEAPEELVTPGHPQLLEDMPEVGAHGRVGDPAVVRDLPVGLSEKDGHRDLLLAPGEPGARLDPVQGVHERKDATVVPFAGEGGPHRVGEGGADCVQELDFAAREVVPAAPPPDPEVADVEPARVGVVVYPEVEAVRARKSLKNSVLSRRRREMISATAVARRRRWRIGVIGSQNW